MWPPFFFGAIPTYGVLPYAMILYQPLSVSATIPPGPSGGSEMMVKIFVATTASSCVTSGCVSEAFSTTFSTTLRITGTVHTWIEEVAGGCLVIVIWHQN